MANTTFTTRIDADLKARLEQIAKYEDRSASYLANQAIKGLVEEREATHELVNVGLQIIDQGVGGTSREAVSDWLRAEDNAPFPKPDADS